VNVWHHNLGVADPGEKHRIYPTRALFTGTGELADVADFTQAQHIEAVAVHELGHFLVNWKLGAYMRSFSIRDAPSNVIPDAEVCFSYPDTVDARRILVGGAAGERACDRWLREEGLWTPARAVYAEVQGQTDRQDALAEDPSITFDGGPNDYSLLQDEADGLLDEMWPLLRRGLPGFCDFVRLTGDAACSMLGIRNNPAV
jgi:hypothetical protein